MRVFTMILSLIYASAAASSETDRRDQSAKIAQECDEKLLSLCETQGALNRAEGRVCIETNLRSLDRECQLVIDKQLRRETAMGLAKSKPSEDTKAEFLFKKIK